MEDTKARSNVYLPPETRKRLEDIAAQFAARYGRRAGRGNGWHSYVIEMAIKMADPDALIQAEESRRRAA